MSSRIIAPLLAITVGVTSGIYVFKPLLQSYAESTGGSFKPEDDHHTAPVPPLPLSGGLMPGKDKDGAPLPSKPEESEEKTV